MLLERKVFDVNTIIRRSSAAGGGCRTGGGARSLCRRTGGGACGMACGGRTVSRTRLSGRRTGGRALGGSGRGFFFIVLLFTGKDLVTILSGHPFFPVGGIFISIGGLLGISVQHDHLVDDNTRAVSLYALLVIPASSLKFSFDKHFLSLGEIRLDDLRELSPSGNVVIFDLLDFFAGFSVITCLVRRDTEIRDDLTSGGFPNFGVCREISDKLNLVQ